MCDWYFPLFISKSLAELHWLSRFIIFMRCLWQNVDDLCQFNLEGWKKIHIPNTVFKISAGPRTLTGKIVVGPTEALTLVVRWSGNNFHGTVIPTNTVPHFKPYIHPHSIVYFSAICFLSLSSWFVSVKLAILRCNRSRGWPLTASEKK